MKKIGIVTVLFLLIAPIAIQTSAVTIPDGFYFHPELVAGAELEWELKKNAFNFDTGEDVDYDIVAGIEWGVGSVLKIVLLQDLNDLVLADPSDLFAFGGEWAEFYLDGVLITENSTDIELFGYSPLLYGAAYESALFPFILPLTYTYGSTNESFFDRFYNELKAEEFTNTTEEGITMYYTVELTTKKLVVDTGIDMKLTEEGITISGEVNAQIVYDVQDGVLDVFQIKMKVSVLGFTIKYNFLLQNITSPVNLDFEWVSGMVAFFGIGVIVVALKKRR